MIILNQDISQFLGLKQTAPGFSYFLGQFLAMNHFTCNYSDSYYYLIKCFQVAVDNHNEDTFDNWSEIQFINVNSQTT